jgi:hypothetical protein
LTPSVKWWLPGSKYSGINGSFANSAATKFKNHFAKNILCQ